MIKYLQRRYALSHKGAVDNIKGILSCALQNISFMLPVGLLYTLVCDLMNNTLTTSRIPFYVIGCIAAAAVILICHRLENSKLGRAWTAIREDETAARKERIYEERKKRAFQEIYDRFSNTISVSYSSGLWDSLDLTSEFEKNDADFFEIYAEYAIK